MKRKLTKSTNNIVLTGSLAGLAEWLGIDPTIVRMIYVLLSLFSAGFPGLVLYIALAVLMPSGRKNNYRGYYNNNQSNPYGQSSSNRKEAEKVDDDDWSDF